MANSLIGGEKMGFEICRLFLQAQNLLTYTKYKGLDPEMGKGGNVFNLPPLKMLTMGVQVSL